ncbi:MAG TPA: glucosidase, partial [Polyangiales bacterium]|nr:glucosidase [Polyangiales bacterium]
DHDRYFDIFIEYAKRSPEDILIQITMYNRGDNRALLYVLPTLWFRNTWSWNGHASRPELSAIGAATGSRTIYAMHPELGPRWLCLAGEPELLFTENETNTERVFGTPNRQPYVKDAFHDYLIAGRHECVNPEQRGTKAAAHYAVTVPAGGSVTLRMRLQDEAPSADVARLFGAEFDTAFEHRIAEADAFYEGVTEDNLDPDSVRVIRQSLAGMLWSKQYYFFDMHDYLVERGVDPLRPERAVRNRDWFHMVNDDIISMPDKWEYPWYAAWDLAFHTLALSMVDLDFAKDQLDLMISEVYLHPNGQIPAYEWNFSDVNPPVHAFAAIFLYRAEYAQYGRGDTEFLQRIFGKLMMNFTWWVNRKDRFGRNVFEGGFLGLDNISVFDRNMQLPNGKCLEQADGTAWMALFCQNMFEICVELASQASVFDYLATKFADHFFWIARAMNQPGDTGMWDEEDGFYYDLLRLPDGSARRLKVRSLVGLLPLCAATVVEPRQGTQLPRLRAHVTQRLEQMPDLNQVMHPLRTPGYGGRTLTSLLTTSRLRRVLSRMLDENEFLSEYGIRSVSKYHEEHPYVIDVAGANYVLKYLPAESDSGMFGGNSNWRGPIWMPVNLMIVRSLLHYYQYYGDSFRIEFPTGSGRELNLFEVAREIAARLARIFLRDPKTGRRAVFGGAEKMQQDPNFRDYLLFYEYFHGDNGAGIGASHQTGWTGVVAKFIDIFARMDANTLLN